MDAGLPDSADKLPSFCLEQELTPEGSSDTAWAVGPSPPSSSPRSPSGWGRACCSSVPDSPPLWAPGTPGRAGYLLGRLFWPLLSSKEETAQGSPNPEPDTSWDGALTWGTTWHAQSRAHPLAPSSAGLRSRRNTSPGPAGLAWRQGAQGCLPRLGPGWGAPRWAFLTGQGLSESLLCPGGSHWPGHSLPPHTVSHRSLGTSAWGTWGLTRMLMKVTGVPCHRKAGRWGASPRAGTSCRLAA